MLDFGACTFCTHLFSLTLLCTHPSVWCLCGMFVCFLLIYVCLAGCGFTPGVRHSSPVITLDAPDSRFYRLFFRTDFLKICSSMFTSFFDGFSKVFPYIFHPCFETIFMFFYTYVLIFLIFLFWANPRRHVFYYRIHVASVHEHTF